ncbi:PH domain-containing protein [Saccharopolyspora oryzae]|uniref:PH domain-containing protein n=1 Tax=Saccharopolyspora oryzae TaxID=2997343 RepID=A0ABT4V6U5_9PSEU|nr:PH domain-containing protein [Saccharopolyspora oryzae]MDA3629680.1 PH domain-containing protein [Saccharopolyspora oryzae]
MADANTTGLRLRPPRNRVERRAIGWWTVQALVLVVPVLVALAVAAVLIPPAQPWLLLALVVVAVLGVPYVLVMPQWRFRVHRWEITDDAVYTAAGWLRQEWRIAPMSRIQTVDTVRGPLQQLFTLSSVTVTTASAAGPLTIDGLDRDTARAVVEQLTATTQATPGDAT